MTAHTLREPRISAAGTGALLLDVAGDSFCLPTQQRLWSMVAVDSPLRASAGFKECVLGVNNLLLVYESLTLGPAEASQGLLQCWKAAQPLEAAGKTHQVTVDYDLSDAGDLAAIASGMGCSRQEVVQLHSSAQYRVACVGSMPGFAYLVGLPDRLAMPRRASPRPAMPKGGVIIGGSQAGIMPCTAPSGWHLLGAADVDTFDLKRSPPSLFAPGDQVRFQLRRECA